MAFEYIGMIQQVRKAFIEQKRICLQLGRRSEIEVDGQRDFVFLNNGPPHSRNFSDELGGQIFCQVIELVFTLRLTYGIIETWKKIYLLWKIHD